MTVPRKTLARHSPRCQDPPPPALRAGIEQFNRGEFWEQHETLEAIWIREPDPVRYLYQGILQVGVGFYHWRRGNRHGAVTKLAQGLEKLEPYRPSCMEVDVERLVAETTALLEQVRAQAELPPFPGADVPRIRLTGSTAEDQARKRPGASPAVQA
jgi:predicted metal-dependent hydrolase